MKLYKIICLFLLIPFFSFATNGSSKKYEKNKTINKTYSVNSNATLYISNKYGNLNITTWNKNRIEIEVRIIVKGNNLNKVEDKLDAISVDFEATRSLVEARTRIQKTSSKWSWSWWGSNNTNYKINYTVKMPVSNNADFNNRYGKIYMRTPLEGKATINCDYGSIEIDRLLNETNFIELDYCGSSDIEYMKYGEIDADYSKITVNKSERVKINVDYTTVKIKETKEALFNIDYGSITINEAEDVHGSSDYAGIRIGTLKNSLKVNTDYGGLRIKNLEKNFSNVTINASYAGIKIGTQTNNSFSFNVDVSYASFRYPESKVDMHKTIKKTTRKKYEGVFGDVANSNSKIEIRSSYGGVSLNINN